MTEQEKLRQAKQWVDCLADGIHPLTGEILPDSDVVNDVRVSRCLFFVAEILRRQLNEQPVPCKSTAKKSFSITLEEREHIVISSQSVPVSVLAQRINDAAHAERMKKCQYVHIVNWLVNAGFLREILRSDGKMRRRPTLQGERLGITVEERTGKNGPYQVVVYSEAAQRFVVDNLEVIEAFSAKGEE